MVFSFSKRLIAIVLFLFQSWACSQQADITVFSAKKIADSFIALHPDTIAYPTEAKSYKWNYEQGLIMEAFYRLWKRTSNKEYLDYIKKNIDYYITDDGSIKTYNLNDFNIDNISPGRILLHMYSLTGNEKYKKAADILRKQLSMQPRTMSGGFWHKKIYPNQMWLDGLFMAEPFYAQYAKQYGNIVDYDDIAEQFLLIRDNLKDRNTGLYYHGWDESKEQKWADPSTGRSPNFWGRSIGWFLIAVADVLDYFPEDHQNRKDLLNIFRDLSESLLNYRDSKTGLWYQVVDKGDKEGNYIEASASSMFTYAFAKGANKGYLDGKFRTIAKESFESIIKNLVSVNNDEIYLNNIVSVGGLGGNPYRDGSFEYYISEPKRTNDFKGYGPFLLAAIELEENPDSGIGNGKKKAALDYYFNNEWRLAPGSQDSAQFHYVWEDTTFSGFSELGEILKSKNTELVALREAPTTEVLKDISLYIIVDPDTKKEATNPKFIDKGSADAIANWVSNGGTLILLANDSANCEFENLNMLADRFGIHFNGDSKNRVTGSNFDMGRIDKFPDHPVFKGVKSIYLKEVSTLKIISPAGAFLMHDGNIVMAESKYGSGYVFAVGDPWMYNEYIDNRKLPEGFENFKAAENLFEWLLKTNVIN